MTFRDLLRNDELPVSLRQRGLVVGVDMVHLVLGLLDLLALFRELLREPHVLSVELELCLCHVNIRFTVPDPRRPDLRCVCCVRTYIGTMDRIGGYAHLRIGSHPSVATILIPQHHEQYTLQPRPDFGPILRYLTYYFEHLELL